MVVKDRSPLFLFHCENCGEYAVIKSTFLKFLPNRGWEKIKKVFEKGAVGAIIRFKDNCPKCEPTGSLHGTIRVLWEREE